MRTRAINSSSFFSLILCSDNSVVITETLSSRDYNKTKKGNAVMHNIFGGALIANSFVNGTNSSS